MAAEDQTQEKFRKITNGPSRWDVMLALFDNQLHTLYRLGRYSFFGRNVMFYYKTDSDCSECFIMSIFSARRQQGENGKLPEEVWTFEGYSLFSSSMVPVRVTDYSFEKRKGQISSSCLQ